MYEDLQDTTTGKTQRHVRQDPSVHEVQKHKDKLGTRTRKCEKETRKVRELGRAGKLREY